MREEDRPRSSDEGWPGSESHGDALDRAVAIGRAFGNPHLLQEVVKLFLVECPRMLDDIRPSISRGDRTAVHIAACGLRNAVIQFGPCDAAEMALTVADAAGMNDWSAAELVYHRLDKAIHELQPLIAALAIDPGR